MRIRNRFHINGFALSLAFKQRLGTTRKWPITMMIGEPRSVAFTWLKNTSVA